MRPAPAPVQWSRTVSERPFLNTETLRLADLHLRDLLFTPIDARFNRIVRLLRHATAARVATVSFIDAEREWFKATAGWTVRDLPLTRSLAASLLTELPLIVPDAESDARCIHHPLVAAEPRFRSFAAYPLRDRFDQIIGAVAVYDTEAGRLTEAVADVMADVGAITQRELFTTDVCSAQAELVGKLDVARRQAMLDDLTRLWNRRAGHRLLRDMVERARRQRTAVGIAVVDIDRFKSINDRHGHACGDLVLRHVATRLVDSVRPQDVVARVGGEEFLILAEGVTLAQFSRLLERVRDRVATNTVRTRGANLQVTLSAGGVVTVPDAEGAGDALMSQADAELFRAKGEGRNAVRVIGIR